jgi:hypothetical protein
LSDPAIFFYAMASVASLKGCAGIWDLAVAAAQGPPAESFFQPDDGTDGKESLFDPDHRTKVDERDYRDKGKYRCKIPLSIALCPFK